MCAHERDGEMTSWQQATTSDKQRQVTSNNKWQATTSDDKYKHEQTKQQSTKVWGEREEVWQWEWATDKERNTNAQTVLLYVPLLQTVRSYLNLRTSATAATVAYVATSALLIRMRNHVAFTTTRRELLSTGSCKSQVRHHRGGLVWPPFLFNFMQVLF